MERHDTDALAETIASLEASNTALRETIKTTAGLMALMQTREQSLRDIVNQQLQTLHAAVDSADHKVNRVVENALPRLTHLTEQALKVALEPAADRFNQRLVSADKTLHQASDRYAHAQQSFETTAMRRMRMASIAMLVAGIMGLGMAGFAVYSAKAALAEATQHRAEISNLKLINRADIISCGEDRLCGNFETKGPRYGDRKQYRPIALRK